VNQCLETFLRCFVSSCPKKWPSWLSLTEYWYNTSFHTAIQCSPFKALYGHSPRHFGISVADSCSVSSLDEWMKDRQLMTEVIKLHLHRATVRMKQQADKGRSEHSFEVGDLVFLRIQPYIQSSLAPRASQKLSFRFFGSFKVLQRVGNVAYRLELPSGSSVHPVFHVSQLKKAVGSSVQVSASLPDDMLELQVPDKILQRRLVTRGFKTVHQVLIQWSFSPASLATWEDLEALRQRFTYLGTGRLLWAGGGGVTEPPGSLVGTLDEDGHSGPAGRRASKRKVKPNKNVYGPEWSNR
jgi:hypothetical protein